MSIHIQNVSGQNLTLVYDTLDLRAIDINNLRDLSNVQAQQVIIMPQRITATYQSEPLVIQMDSKRIRVGLFQSGAFEEFLQMPRGAEVPEKRKVAHQDIGTVPLWRTAIACHQLVSSATLVAYGFNYSVEAILETNNAVEAFTSLVHVNQERVMRAFDGDLVSFAATPRLAFQRDQTVYDLVLMPAEEQHIRVTFNVHFEYEGVVLPAEKELEQSYHDEFKTCTTLLSRLFDEN